jgi:beta-glucanase (GH16 family)
MKYLPFKTTIMRSVILVVVVFLHSFFFAQAQILRDNFEGNRTITSWTGDDCIIDTSFNNPFQTGINNSSKVLKYTDAGGLFANVRFDAGFSFNLSTSSEFSLKIYVPSSGLTGSQTNQISLKLQNGLLGAPWSTQCEIIKPIVLNQWQTVTFNFATDTYINLNPSSGNPLTRWDFNRVLLQVNGENNNANVLAYIDDFVYAGAISTFNSLVWNDDFDANGAVNSTKWFHQTQLPNGVSWYNNEQQHYTNRTVNSFINNGLLNIVAKREVFNSQGQTKQFTSARLNSKFAFKYGRVEVRAKLPTGAGTWPAIWMLGKNINEPGGYWTPTHGTTNWPACGEIDIMEHWGTNQNVVSSAVHFPVNGNLNAGQYVTNAQNIPGVSNNFHVYAVDWNAERITFSVDGINHFSYNPATKNQYTWPFDAEQYLLLNVAIEPSVTVGFMESSMEIDYVRVYQQNAPLPLQFTHFSIFSRNEKTVEHSWTTANEINVSHFNIQRNTNGRDFLNIGSIAAKNNSANSYEYTDRQLPNTNEAAIYYRIQSIDKDGKALYSVTRQMNAKNATQNVVIYPNPAKDYISIVAQDDIREIKIINQSAQTVKQVVVYAKQATLPIKNFAKGTYIVQLILENGKIIAEKLVID